jgi:hypothetical protein
VEQGLNGALKEDCDNDSAFLSCDGSEYV